MNILKKLTSRRGETLTETLVALLIVGLASGVLATMVGAASHMNKTAMDKDEVLYKAVTTAETRPGTGTGGKVNVTVGGTAVEFGVSYHSDATGNTPGTLYAYSYTKGGGTP